MRSYDELNLLWQYDNAPKMDTLMRGVHDVAKGITPIDFSMIPNPNTDYSRFYCYYFMSLLNIGVIDGIVQDAMFWGISLWGDDYWNGSNLTLRADVAYRYAQFKLFLNNRIPTYAMIKEGLDILVPTASHFEITENSVNDFTIKIYSADTITGLQEIIAKDTFLFGKITGIKYNTVYILEV